MPHILSQRHDSELHLLPSDKQAQFANWLRCAVLLGPVIKLSMLLAQHSH